MVLVRVAASAVNHTDARISGTNRCEQEFFENEAGVRKVQTVEIEMRLNGKTPGSQIIQIKTSVRLNRAFDVFGRVLDFDITSPDKVFQRA